MRILCVGANHRTADLAVRERLALDADQRADALRALRETWPEAEFAVLSTCNRTEVYAARPVHGHPRADRLGAWLLGRCGVGPGAGGGEGLLYTLTDAEATRHLFAVASGLDSLVPGEDQIVAQVKDAYAEAAEADAAGGVLSELFQGALHVAKHVRTETDIAMGKVSVASVAVEFVAQVFETLAGKTVLNVGAGEMNELMLQHLRDAGAESIVVANRSRPAAERLAEAFAARAAGLDELGELLPAADVVLTSTGSPEAILTAKDVADAQRTRGYRPLLIVDIAVPRDVAPEAGQVESVFLYNIDDLEQVVRATLARRADQQQAADGIIDEHVDELLGGLKVRQVAPTIEALYRRMQRIADDELADARNKLGTHDDAEEDMAILERTLHRTIRRMLHPCTARLRSAAGSDAARAHVAALRDLFHLDAEDEPDDDTPAPGA